MTTSDKFLNGKVIVKQPEKGYRAGIDAVLLAAAVHPKASDHILDIGAGVGTVMLCLAALSPNIHITGLEIQPDLVALNQQNISDNHFADRLKIIQGDIMTPPSQIKPNSYDHVISNPPFYAYGQKAYSDSKSKSLARHVTSGTVQDWINSCLRFVKPRGYLTLIHRTDQLDDIISALKSKSGEIKIFPLWPDQEKPAKLVIIQARKSVKSGCQLLTGLVLHNGKGKYTKKAVAVFRGKSKLGL